jgi:putative transcriptional regulator
MTKKLTGAALAKFEAERDVWQEVLEGVLEIKAGGGKRAKVQPASQIVRARMNSGLSQSEFAAVLGVSKRTLEQWEQGRRKLLARPRPC